jgi:tetratricopeptide (TPR) repeat protein
MDEAFAACTGGALEDGIAALDAQVQAAPGQADPLVLRGLCYWTRWDRSGDDADAQQAYDDLSAAIAALESSQADGGEATTPLDRVYSYRAFVAHALDDEWGRTVEDLDRAAELAPNNATHAMDHGVARSYVGDTLEARRELERFLSLTDDSTDAQRRDLAESLLTDLEGASSAE